MKWPALLFYLFILISCLETHQNFSEASINNKQDLLHYFGEPLIKENSDPYVIYHYNDGISYYIKNEEIYSKHFVPKGMQSSLSYWRNRAHPHESVLRNVAGQIHRDGKPFRETLFFKGLNVELLYEPSEDRVLKVIHLK